jgi:hypothetical protein
VLVFVKAEFKVILAGSIGIEGELDSMEKVDVLLKLEVLLVTIIAMLLELLEILLPGVFDCKLRRLLELDVGVGKTVKMGVANREELSFKIPEVAAPN